MPTGTEPVRDGYALALDLKPRGDAGDGDRLRVRTNSRKDALAGGDLRFAHGRPWRALYGALKAV
jgi:hypothetical protein